MGSDKKSAGAALDAVCNIITAKFQGWRCYPSWGWKNPMPCASRKNGSQPATGEQFMKAADKVVKMTIAKALKDSVNS